MRTPHLILAVALAALSARATPPTADCDPLRPMTPWQSSLEALARGEARASMATINFAETDAPTAAPAKRLQHGSDCFVAAQRALELNNPARARALMAEAKASLLLSRAQLPAGAAAQRSQTAYFLGLMAEREELDLETAARYYAEAAQLFPKNTDAQDALERVQRYLAFRRTLKG